MSSFARRFVHALAALLSTLALAACGDDGSGGPAPVDPPLGDLRFEEVGLPTDAVAGHPFPVHVRLIADAEKHHVTVLLRLVRLEGTDPAGVDPTPVTHDERVWSAVIGRMEAGVPVALDETVDLPGALAPGDYAAVFELNAVDFTAEDDHLQGEEAADLANNALVLPDAVRVTSPAAPDLQFEGLELVLHHFTLPPTGGELLGANLAVESKALPATAAFTVTAELGIPGGEGTAWYPLAVGAADGVGGYASRDAYVFAPKEHALDDGSTLTAALAANRPEGIHLDLLATPQAADALAALEAVTDCEVRVHLDREDAVVEHSEENNPRATWARFYPADVFDPDWFETRPAGGRSEAGSDTVEQGLQVAGQLIPGVAAATVDVERDRHDSFGNDAFGAGYSLEGVVSHADAASPPVGAGSTIVLFDANGAAVELGNGWLWPNTTPVPITLRALNTAVYALEVSFIGSRPVISVCNDDPDWTGFPAGSLEVEFGDHRAACTGFRLIDRNGGALENGDRIDLQAGNGLYVGPVENVFGQYLYAAAFSAPGPSTAFTLAVPDQATGLRHLRFTTDDHFDVTVLGQGYTPMRARAVAALDLDVADNNLWGYALESFGVVLDQRSTPFAVDSSGTITVYDREEELYSRSVSRSRDFLVGGVVPVTVTATATAALGLRGRVTAGPTRRLTVGVGPYVDVTGRATAEVNYGIASGGVDSNLRFLKVTQLYDNSLVLTANDTKRYEFGGELLLQTLDGDVSVWASVPVGCGTFGLDSCQWRQGILSWAGHAASYDWPETVGRDLR